jgi:hypothetical protein
MLKKLIIVAIAMVISFNSFAVEVRYRIESCEAVSEYNYIYVTNLNKNRVDRFTVPFDMMNDLKIGDIVTHRLGQSKLEVIQPTDQKVYDCATMALRASYNRVVTDNQ